MSPLLKFKGAFLAETSRCPLCQSFRRDTWFPAALFDNPEVSEGYLPRDGAQASVVYFCGYELAIDEFGEIIRTRDCTSIGDEKASELNQEAEDRFEENEECAA